MDKLNNFLKKLPRNIIISLVIIFTLQFLAVGCSTYDLIPQDDYVKLQTDIAVCRADTEGGRAVEEQVKALDKRQEDLKRREDILNKREDEINSRERDFNTLIEKKGIESGKAEQIQKDYVNTQNQLTLTFIAIPFVSLLLVGLVFWIFLLFDKIKKLEYAKISAEKTIDTLRSKFNNPSVSVEEIKTVLETYTQLSNPTSSVLPPTIQSGTLPPTPQS